MRVLLSFLIALSLIDCTQKKDFYSVATQSATGHYQAVIEIPAGTNKKYEYNRESNIFEIDKKKGVERVINFLPYPANYGFIPSTYADPKKGGDGDALDVLVIAETVPTGTIVEIIPIGILKLIDNEEEDYKIVAIPQANSQQVITTKTYQDFILKHPEGKQIIELWFTSYDKSDTLFSIGWGDEKEAVLEIEKNKTQRSPVN